MISTIILLIRKRFKGSFTHGEGIPVQKRHPCPKNCLKVEQLLRNQRTFITMNTQDGWSEQPFHKLPRAKKEVGPGIISRKEIIRTLQYGLHEPRAKMDEDRHVGEIRGSDSHKCSMKNKEAMGAC